jgi:rubrerythrin
MRMVHEQLLAKIAGERERIVSRRGLLTGTTKIAAGGAVALALGGGSLRARSAFAQADERDEAFETDIDVLNYALTLEHLEYAFYRDGIDQFTFGNDPFGTPIATNLAAIRDHEGAHVDTLTQVITDLGGEPVAEAEYNFGYTDAASFLATAAALENTGVSAYDGAGASIENPDLLTAAGTIVAVEARHAAYLNLVIGEMPFPAAFETAKTPAEILEIAGPFIVS